jgi:hypothetical protein
MVISQNPAPWALSQNTILPQYAVIDGINVFLGGNSHPN